MSSKLANTILALLVAFATLGIAAGSASAASSPAFATPGTFSCNAATAANEIPAPPPLWESSGKAPSADETARANATQPLCPAGQVPSAIEHGPATLDLTPTHGEAVTGPLGTASTGPASTGATGEPSVTPPAYGGVGCEYEGCYWYADNEVNKSAIGMEYQTNISEPHVSSFSSAHSIDQLAIGDIEEGKTFRYTIEVGWDVDPGMFASSTKPHLFIFVNPDKYGSESCYDCHFVAAAEAKLTPGETLEPSTAKFTLAVKYTGGNWWIWAGTQWIGYVPGSAWGGNFTKGTSESNYGEVFDNEEHPTSAMGDGQFGSSSAATEMTQSVVTLPSGAEETTGYHGEVTNSSLYSIGDINSGKTEWHFGGPGDPTPPTVTSQSATGVGQEQATLHGKVDANGFSTHYHFQYGETTSYGSSTAEDSAGSGYGNESKQETLTELQPSSTYHYRIVAVSSAGTSYGSDESFVTPRAAQPALTTESGGLAMIWRGTDGDMFDTDAPTGEWKSFSPTWSQVGIPSGVTPVGNPVTTTESGGGLAIIWRGSDGNIYDTDAPTGEWKTFSPTWSKVGIPSGVTAVSDPVVVKEGSGIGIIWRGSDGNIYDTDAPTGEWKSFSPTWSKVGIPSGVTPASDPVIATEGSGFGIIWRGSDGNIYDTDAPTGEWKSFSPTWSKVGIPSGVTPKGDPTTFTEYGGGLGIIWRGSDGNIYDTDAPTGEWKSFSPTWSRVGIPSGVTPKGDPTTFTEYGGGLGIIWRGSDGNIYDTDAPTGEWKSFSPTWSRVGIPSGVTAKGDPVTAIEYGGGVGIFWRGSDGNIYDTDAPTGEWKSFSPTWSKVGIPSGVTMAAN
jgi:hypothetical protein